MTRTLAAAALMSLALPASAGASTPFWFSWFGHDRPVVYRPLVTPETFYFQPAPAPHAAQERHPRARICRPARHRCR